MFLETIQIKTLGRETEEATFEVRRFISRSFAARVGYRERGSIENCKFRPLFDLMGLDLQTKNSPYLL